MKITFKALLSKIIISTIALIVVILSSGCGSQNTPEGAVRHFYHAATCSNWKKCISYLEEQHSGQRVEDIEYMMDGYSSHSGAEVNMPHAAVLTDISVTSERKYDVTFDVKLEHGDRSITKSISVKRVNGTWLIKNADAENLLIAAIASAARASLANRIVYGHGPDHTTVVVEAYDKYGNLKSNSYSSDDTSFNDYTQSSASDEIKQDDYSYYEFDENGDNPVVVLEALPNGGVCNDCPQIIVRPDGEPCKVVVTATPEACEDALDLEGMECYIRMYRKDSYSDQVAYDIWKR